jgi:hypothetical protein
MKTYIGTKLVNMLPMTRQQYNDFRGWTLPADENGADEGYLVEYLDGGKPNTPRYAGYVSWSPKAQADAAYRPTDGMSFGLAIEALKKGKRVARTGWNGKGMFLYIVKGAELQSGLKYGFGEYQNEPRFVDSICMKAANNDLVVGWLASQTDVLADDWQIAD